jgi:hypothetical protein
LIYLERVANEIKDVGLYDLILQDVQKILQKEKPTQKEILEVLKSHPQILRDYKQLNVEYNLSNIHLRPINIDKMSDSCKSLAATFNKNLEELKELEPYTLDFEQSSTLVIIFSVEFFVLFSVQYFIVLLNLKKWQWYIYALFAMSVVVAWAYAKKEQKKFARNKQKFDRLYKETLEVLKNLEQKGCIKKEDLIIRSCDEHI